jgi:TPR repeat protein
MLLLLILAAIGGLVYLQYVKEGKSWVAPWAHQQPTTPVQASQSEQQTQPGQTSAPETNSAQTNASGANNQTGNAPAGTSQNPPANQPAASTPAQDEQKQGENASSDHAGPEPAKSANAAEENKETAKAEKPSDENSDEEEAPPAAAKPARTPKPRATRPVTPAASPDDALVANAEKYLYGRGVPQNCDRALGALRSAADHQNERARSLLGTMYATGHCVPKDLPNAYRWFALASRGNPDNMWVQRNLEMIWREMTPQERQVATRSQ